MIEKNVPIEGEGSISLQNMIGLRANKIKKNKRRDS